MSSDSIYPSKLQLNKANTFDTGTSFSDLLEYLAILQTSTITIDFKLRNILNKAIGIELCKTFFSKVCHQYNDLITEFHFLAPGTFVARV